MSEGGPQHCSMMLHDGMRDCGTRAVCIAVCECEKAMACRWRVEEGQAGRTREVLGTAISLLELYGRLLFAFIL